MSQDNQALSFSLAIKLKHALAKARLISVLLDLGVSAVVNLVTGYLHGRTQPVVALRFLERESKEFLIRFF